MTHSFKTALMLTSFTIILPVSAQTPSHSAPPSSISSPMGNPHRDPNYQKPRPHSGSSKTKAIHSGTTKNRSKKERK